jgi:sugar lactone lactonase YvrE
MTAGRELTTLVAGGHTYLEGVRWRDDRLWFSDLYLRAVFATDSDGSVERVVEVPGQPSGLGWLPDGSMLVVSMKDRRILRWDGRRLVEHADLSAHAPCHLNEMVVDNAGRAYVGNFGSDVLHGAAAVVTAIHRVDLDGTVTTAAEDLRFPNGMVVTDDGRLLVAESMGNRITQFTIAADGTLHDRRPFAEFGDLVDLGPLEQIIPQLQRVPDGITLDADGAVWFADAFAKRVVRVLDGTIVDEVDTSPFATVAVTLGGPDGKTLFLCATTSISEEQCLAERAARILTVTVDTPHAGLP